MVQEEFVNTILDILSPISNITTVRHQGFVGLYKDDIMFGKIISKSVLFLSDRNKFIKIKLSLFCIKYIFIKYFHYIKIIIKF